ncbi:MAG: hypothetical protein JW955_21395 [Sedimentisphaerales bacterium]|nr:hypothetical protein [Sedimentisphaerales bacterium]
MKMHVRASQMILALLPVIALASSLTAADVKVHVFWGHQAQDPGAFHVKALTEQVEVVGMSAEGMEAEDRCREGLWQTTAGASDVDGLVLTLRYDDMLIQEIGNLHGIWKYLFEHGDVDTAGRLRNDAAFRPDPRRLTIQVDEQGARGFSVAIDQLLRNKVFWIPSLDLYLAVGEMPISFEEHQRQLQPWRGKRILDQVHAEPEATYEQYTARWEDMGSPQYVNPSQPFPGHIVCITWDSAIPKFGIDRGAGVWSDLGNPDRLRFWYDFGDLSSGLGDSWKGQRLKDGLPVITTSLEKSGIGYEVEQFAYPLSGPPKERRGNIPMVLLQKLTFTNREDTVKRVSVTIHQQREIPEPGQLKVVAGSGQEVFSFENSLTHDVLFAMEGTGLSISQIRELNSGDRDEKSKSGTWRVKVAFDLAANGVREIIVKLPSPVVSSEDRAGLRGLSYARARSQTLAFWEDYLRRGAHFRISEPAVNELFRASLWHALRLPRRHGGAGDDVKIDLPYSNFAYGQQGTPWPVNQAVYVDYMLYDLRGYHDIAVEELAAMYRNNQEANGRVGGYANWGVYAPGMIYAVAKDYLLSGDRAALDKLMPYTLKALDWCLGEIRRQGPSVGLVRAPLNDLTGDGAWAFNQAYVCAGLDLFGRVLKQINHPRAQECLAAASDFKRAVQRGFEAATVRSPLVQLRDRTWTPYVPCEATRSGRLYDQWYPTDVDTGALHLSRLRALDPAGPLTTCLLNDHEDNLFLGGWGMANEPVYNQQATVYLLRDDPKAVIRAFYSMMACAFSHSVFEPVEHRWAWGQYFGPPSTDGAWFELYRHMLIHELDDDTLLLMQAAPRKWLEGGKSIEVQRAPTYYGRMSMRVDSHAASGTIVVEIDMPDRTSPRVLLVRLRHPQGMPIRSVVVNGAAWTDFNIRKEWLRIERPDQRHYSIVASYR